MLDTNYRKQTHRFIPRRLEIVVEETIRTILLPPRLTLGDDADTLGDGLGRDGMVAGDHDDLDACRAALGHRVRHGGTRRVNHRHEADEAQALQREVDLVRVERVVARVLVARQRVVTESCRQESRLRQSNLGGTEGSLQVPTQIKSE